MKLKKTKLSHGICTKCGFEIVCEENLTCFQHPHITYHLDLNDCIGNLKSPRCDFDCDNCEVQK